MRTGAVMATRLPQAMICNDGPRGAATGREPLDWPIGSRSRLLTHTGSTVRRVAVAARRAGRVGDQAFPCKALAVSAVAGPRSVVEWSRLVGLGSPLVPAQLCGDREAREAHEARRDRRRRDRPAS